VWDEAMAAFGRLVEAIPKGQRGEHYPDVARAENWMRKAAAVLGRLAALDACRYDPGTEDYRDAIRDARTLLGK
jgi:hypothetical protein